MAREFRMCAQIESTARPNWLAGAAETISPMQPTPGARVINLRGSFANGQNLAGSGALVFEGEVLEAVRLN